MLSDLENIAEPIENGLSFEDNAKIKSDYFYNTTNLTSLSDDSGFIVDELIDYPGINTARLAKKLGGEQKVIDHIFSKFRNRKELKSTFYCSLAIIGKKENLICSGKVEGKIIPNKIGEKGFGYDPYFIPSNKSKTFAEMKDNEKMMISHRFQAFKVLANQKL